MDNVVKPYSTSQDKKTEVTQMFNNISGNYDFLNRFLSLGIDVYWRSRVIRLLEQEHPKTVLDVATGTADLAIGIAKKMNTKVLGVDISNKMIDVGHQKVKQESLEASVQLMVADSENLNFADNSYDAATVSFGVRNFENVEQGLQEIHRVLKPSACFIVLEFSMPQKFPIKQMYNFYFRNILPLIGKLISKDPKAYSYLFESVQHFPYGEKFVHILQKVGFKNVTFTPLTFGIVTLYKAYK